MGELQQGPLEVEVEHMALRGGDGTAVDAIHARPDGMPVSGIVLHPDLMGIRPLYDDLCRLTGHHHDPCLLDTFIAAVQFMEGAPKKPWWKYTTERKRVMAARDTESR